MAFVRNKDRLSPESRLTLEESLRFREAFYKCWIVYCLFDSETVIRSPTPDGEPAPPNPKLRFLADSSVEEIVAMYEVSNFLEDVARHTLEYKDIRSEGQPGNSSLSESSIHSLCAKILFLRQPATMGSANINIPPDEILRCFVSQTCTYPPRIMHPTRDRTLRKAWVELIGKGVEKFEEYRITRERPGFVEECKSELLSHL